MARTLFPLVVRGKLTGDDMAGLIASLKEIHQAGHKARLYVDLSDADVS